MSKRNRNIDNNIEFNELIKSYKNLAIQVYQWENLPPHLNSHLIEKMLYENGLICFMEYQGGLIHLKATPSAECNIMGEPISYIITGFKETFTKNKNDVVLVHNNNLDIPTSRTVKKYASKIFNIEKTIDINTNAQKTPYIVSVSDNNILTLKNIIKQIDEYEMAIYKDKNFNIQDTIKVTELTAPYICDKLLDLKNSLENELLTRIGINNVDTDKRERLVTDEINSNNDEINKYLSIGLEHRKKACEEINKRYGLNISVKVGGIDESIHNDNKTDIGNGS